MVVSMSVPASVANTLSHRVMAVLLFCSRECVLLRYGASNRSDCGAAGALEPGLTSSGALPDCRTLGKGKRGLLPLVPVGPGGTRLRLRTWDPCRRSSSSSSPHLTLPHLKRRKRDERT